MARLFLFRVPTSLQSALIDMAISERVVYTGKAPAKKGRREGGLGGTLEAEARASSQTQKFASPLASILKQQHPGPAGRPPTADSRRSCFAMESPSQKMSAAAGIKSSGTTAAARPSSSGAYHLGYYSEAGRLFSSSERRSGTEGQYGRESDISSRR